MGKKGQKPSARSKSGRRLLTDGQKKVAIAQLATQRAMGESVSEAARVAELSVDQAHHLLREAEGRAALMAAVDAIRAESLGLAKAFLESRAMKAVLALERVLDDPQARPADRVKASTAILDRIGIHPKRTVEHTTAAAAADATLSELEELGAEALRYIRAHQKERADAMALLERVEEIEDENA